MNVHLHVYVQTLRLLGLLFLARRFADDVTKMCFSSVYNITLFELLL